MRPDHLPLDTTETSAFVFPAWVLDTPISSVALHAYAFLLWESDDDGEANIDLAYRFFGWRHKQGLKILGKLCQLGLLSLDNENSCVVTVLEKAREVAQKTALGLLP